MTCRDCGEPQHGRSEIEMLACQIRWVLRGDLPDETVAALTAAAKRLDADAANARAAERQAAKFW